MLDGPTETVDLLHVHVTTLAPGKVSGEPVRHLQEEVLIVKDGEVEADGTTQKAGPGRASCSSRPARSPDCATPAPPRRPTTSSTTRRRRRPRTEPGSGARDGRRCGKRAALGRRQAAGSGCTSGAIAWAQGSRALAGRACRAPAASSAARGPARRSRRLAASWGRQRARDLRQGAATSVSCRTCGRTWRVRRSRRRRAVPSTRPSPCRQRRWLIVACDRLERRAVLPDAVGEAHVRHDLRVAVGHVADLALRLVELPARRLRRLRLGRLVGRLRRRRGRHRAAPARVRAADQSQGAERGGRRQHGLSSCAARAIVIGRLPRSTSGTAVSISSGVIARSAISTR